MELAPAARIEVRTPDGAMETDLHHPAGAGPHPVAIMYHDAFGVRPAMHDIARRLASHGYLVALPNIFYRSGSYPPFDRATVWTDPPERERLMAIMKQAEAAAVMRDTEALLAALATHPLALHRAARVGVFGYCLGGRLSFYAAVRTDSPPRITGRLYFGVAENDRSCTAEQIALLRETLDKAKVMYDLEVYPAAHGFAVGDAPVYNKAAAEQHWERLLSLFGSTLRA